MIDPMREGFEKWCKPYANLRRYPNGEYRDIYTDREWRVWQACWQAAIAWRDAAACKVKDRIAALARDILTQTGTVAPRPFVDNQQEPGRVPSSADVYQILKKRSKELQQEPDRGTD